MAASHIADTPDPIDAGSVNYGKDDSVKVDGTTLTGVSETALLTLWYRGSEAARPDPIIEDPYAVRLLGLIDYPYREQFGAADQTFAMRALAFDASVRDFLREYPNGTVVALAEGLQTSYWRLGCPPCRWISVDLPPIIALRKKLLPNEMRIETVEASALEPEWMDLVEPGSPILITAEGLLCYLEEPLALGLIQNCAARFPGGRFLFDSVPRWWSRRKHKAFGVKAFVTRKPQGTAGYVIPPMPFGISSSEIATFPNRFPGIESARAIPAPAGRGLRGRMIQAAYGAPLVPSRWRFAITELRFGASGTYGGDD